MNNDKIKNGDAMSGNTSSGARRRRTTKVGAWLGAAALCVTGASLVPLGGHTQAAPGDPMSEGMLCTDGNVDANGAPYVQPHRQRRLYERARRQRHLRLGLRRRRRLGKFQLPGPVLCAWQGETVIVNLANQLPVSTSIQFPGQHVASLPLGCPSVRCPAVAILCRWSRRLPPASVSYSFTAGSAGTYLYESGSDPQLQVQMGLFGASSCDRPASRSRRKTSWRSHTTMARPGQTNADAGMTLDDARRPAAACAYADSTD